MKKSVILVMITVIFLLVFVAGGLATPDDKINVKAPIFAKVVDPCTDETVELEGTGHLNGRILIDGAEGFHLKAHVNVHLTGVGLPSETEYIANGIANLTLKLKEGSADVLTGILKIQLISKGKEANPTLTIKVHVTRNANGDFTSLVFDIGGVECP